MDRLHNKIVDILALLAVLWIIGAVTLTIVHIAREHKEQHIINTMKP
jgi:preprotein translocase subunit SecG